MKPISWLTIGALVWVFALASGCNVSGREFTQANKTLSSIACNMVRIEDPATGNGFNALGPSGDFYLELPEDSTGHAAATQPGTSGTPVIYTVGGWLYLEGTDPVAYTPVVAAGAQGCEILIVFKHDGTGDYQMIYFLTGTDGHGFVRDKNDPTNHQEDIKNNVYVKVRKVGTTLTIDPPQDMTGVDEPLIKFARDEYDARPH